MEIGKTHNITEQTPKNMALGAGIVVHGLTFESDKWTYTGIFGATNGGSKLEIKPEYLDLEVDGKLVKTKGLTVKIGEIAQLETNLAEVTADNLKMVVGGKAGEGFAGFAEIVSKPQLDEGDYVENLGFIGYTVAGEPIIVKFDNALCTSGLEYEGKNKEQVTIKAVFECYADLSAKDLTTLPYHIYTKSNA